MIADVTHDETTCALFRQWCNHPWDGDKLAVLRDRLEETGQSAAAEYLRNYHLFWKGWKRYPRRWRQRCVRGFRSIMIQHFGDFTRRPPLRTIEVAFDELPF